MTVFILSSFDPASGNGCPFLTGSCPHKAFRVLGEGQAEGTGDTRDTQRKLPKEADI